MMPKRAEIVAALSDISAIESYATLKAEMVDMFTDLAEHMSSLDDKRPAQIMRKMVATIDTVPYDMLAELGHNYHPTLICAVMILHAAHAEVPDYSDARDLVETLLDELRRIDLEHPDRRKAIEMIDAILKNARRPSG